MLPDDPLWYKDAILYECHVRAFHDGIGEGVGDFRGLTQKLDYLQDLGITALWVLPFYPSPQRDDGYDIADYTSINPAYGTQADFQDLLAAAHERGIRVITELVLNHTSDQHPWFQRARRVPPGSSERNFYVWSDTPDKYTDARIIFKDFEPSNWSWDPVAKAYFWHRFYSHQPDLNYDNPAVWEAIFPVVDFWLSLGVDGMRLDAVPYLFEREGTSCENLPETHSFLKAVRRHIDLKFPNRMLLSEANQWPEDAVAYFGNGDESHMAFHFPLMPRMFMSIHMEDRFPIIDILAQTPLIPDNCQWCQFLRNHDELTLEMVTDEERDYMYRAYAGDQRARINLGIRRRLAPLLGNNRRRIELMNGLLFSLPGTPVVYYGDEIGMGDNIYLGDRNGVRTPMQWSSDRNAGFSRANPQKLYLPVIIDPEYHYEAINVEAQNNNPNSLLWWMKRLIALRKRYQAFSRGTLEMLLPANRKVLAFVRKYKDEQILVVANLSRFVQHVELDLSAAKGAIPVELFGRTQFPTVTPGLYPLTLGPHAFYWFELEPPEPQSVQAAADPAVVEPPTVFVAEGKLGFLRSQAREQVEPAVAAYLQQTGWAGGLPHEIKAVHFLDVARVPSPSTPIFLAMIEVEYVGGKNRTCLLPTAVVSEERFEELRKKQPLAAIVRLKGSIEGLVIDALHAAEAAEQLVRLFAGPPLASARGAEIAGTLHGSIDWAAASNGAPLVSPVSEDSTSAQVVVAEELLLKIFRQVEPGIHPEVEVGRFLAQHAGFGHAAPLVGTLHYRRRGTDPVILADLQRFIVSEGTAWQAAVDDVSRYFERVLALPPEQRDSAPMPRTPLSLSGEEPPPLVRELLGRVTDLARLLGERTAELHRALAAENADAAFAPEGFTPLSQRSLYQSLRNVHQRTLHQLARRLDSLPAEQQEESRYVLSQGDEILRRFHAQLSRRRTGQRIRCHGNLSLTELLFTGKDFVFVDFEGDSDRSLGDRRMKRSPLTDVASMILSLHHAASAALVGNGHQQGRTPGMIRPADVAVLRPWAEAWFGWIAQIYARSYMEHSRESEYLPETPAECETLLLDFVLEEALKELGQELEQPRPWLSVPLRAIRCLLGEPVGNPGGST